MTKDLNSKMLYAMVVLVARIDQVMDLRSGSKICILLISSRDAISPVIPQGDYGAQHRPCSARIS